MISKSSRNIVVVFTALLLMQCTFAEGIVEVPAVAAIALLIAAVLLGVAFMVARISGVATWEAWVRDEFGELITSAVLCAFFVAIAFSAEMIAQTFATDILASKNLGWIYSVTQGRWHKGNMATGICFAACPVPPGEQAYAYAYAYELCEIQCQTGCVAPCHIYVARGFLGSVYEKYAEQMGNLTNYYSKSYFLESIAYGSAADLNLLFMGLGFGIYFDIPLHAGRAIYNNLLRIAISPLTQAMVMVKLQEMILLYIPELALQFFGFGVVLRTLWFTRKLGGLLVAIAVGVYFILPFIYVLGWYSVESSTISLSETFNFPNSYSEIASFSNPSISDVFFTADLMSDTSAVGLFDIISRIYIPSLAIPLIAIFTTIGFIRHFSPMIGGDTEIAGLTRLI